MLTFVLMIKKASQSYGFDCSELPRENAADGLESGTAMRSNKEVDIVVNSPVSCIH